LLACAGSQPERSRFCTNATCLCRNATRAPTFLHKLNLLVQEVNQSAHVSAQTQPACARMQPERLRYCTTTTCLCRKSTRTHTFLHKHNLLVQECNQSAHVSAQTQLACAGTQSGRPHLCTNATCLCTNSIRTPASMHKRNLLVHKLNQD